MSGTSKLPIDDLPPNVQEALGDFVEAASDAFRERLRSLVLFGSAAEGHLRPTSDVNVIVVLTAFDRAAADELREPLRVAQAAVGLEAMFLLESEMQHALDAFAVKFADVLKRRRILFGTDPFAGVTVSREAQIARVRQVLLNLSLRLREQYVLRSLREEQAAIALADAAGPLRACAAAICELEDRTAALPKAALEQLALELGPFAELLAHITAARQQQRLPARTAPSDLFAAVELAAKMHGRALSLN